jgi:hypothetical protein
MAKLRTLIATAATDTDEDFKIMPRSFDGDVAK